MENNNFKLLEEIKHNELYCDLKFSNNNNFNMFN